MRARHLDRVARGTTREPLARDVEPAEHYGQRVGNFVQSTGEFRMNSAR
jgi:hypothetical protein